MSNTALESHQIAPVATTSPHLSAQSAPRRLRRPPPLQVPDRQPTSLPTSFYPQQSAVESDKCALQVPSITGEGDGCVAVASKSSSHDAIAPNTSNSSRYSEHHSPKQRAGSIHDFYATLSNGLKNDSDKDSSPIAVAHSRCGTGRRENQDCISFLPPSTCTSPLSVGQTSVDDCVEVPFPTAIALYGVYDGHGGKAAAEYASLHLPYLLAPSLCPAMAQRRQRSHGHIRKKCHSSHSTSIQAGRCCHPCCASHRTVSGDIREQHVRSAFHAIDGEICGACGPTSILGTTATVAAILPPSHASGILQPMLYVSHVGDSRALVVTHNAAFFLTSDHNPSRADESERIHRGGGVVLRKRVNGVLAVSRSLGDRCLKPVVISTPDVIPVPLSVHHRYLILATDGFWDLVNEHDVQHILSAEGCDVGLVHNIAHSLADLAAERGSTDDISVMAIDLRAHIRE